MSEEVKPLEQSGEVVVSSPAAKMVKCKGCGSDTPQKGRNTQFCEACSKTRPKVHSKNRKEKQATTNMQAASTVEVKPKDARKILEARGLRHPRAIEVCLQLAEVAARNLRIPFNGHLLKHGVQATLAKVKGEAFQPPAVEDVWKLENQSPLREHELWAIYDFSCSWRDQKNGKPLSFDEWMELRRISVTDLFRFGKDIIGLDLHDEPHGRWCREMFVQKRYLLPEQYNWEDVKVAIAAQSDIHQRILASSRSSYKSSVNLVDLLQWVLAFNGDIRVFIISSTTPLSAGFLRKFRSYWTVKNPNEPTLFNQLYPEFMIQADDSGSTKNFVSPMRRLDLIQPSLASAGLDSQGLAGERCDLFCAEDLAEISNSNSPEQREKTLEKFDMLRELLEPFGYLQIVCTPFASGKGTEEDPGDVYAVLLRREQRHIKNGGDPRLVTVICPAWTVKPGVRKQPHDPSLDEAEVDLLFPSRLTFKYLMAKLRENLTTDRTAKIFRQQSLCQWCPDEDETLVVRFDHDEIWRRVKPMSSFQPVLGAQTFLAVDRSGGSISRYADFNAVVVGRLHRVQDQQALVVVDAKLERARDSDLIVNVLVPFIIKHKPTVIIFEEDRHWADFEMNLRRELLRRNIPVPWIRHTPIDTTPKSKSRRIARLELPLGSGRLYFNSAIAELEACLLQLEKFDGITSSNSHRKDDFCDSLSLLAATVLPRTHEGVSEEDPNTARQREKQQEEDYQQGARQDWHNRVFGGAQLPNVQTRTEWERQQRGEPSFPTPQAPTRPLSPRDAALQQMMKILPPNMRGRNR